LDKPAAFLLVALGGAAGSVLRYGTALLFTKYSAGFPLATFTVNIAGSFMMGLLLAWSAKQSFQHMNYYLLLATGLCGGFTTFSALSAECFQFIRLQQYTTCILYLTSTLLLGIAACAAGFFIYRYIS